MGGEEPFCRKSWAAMFCNFSFVEQDHFLAGGLIILHSCLAIACNIAEDVGGGQ